MASFFMLSHGLPIGQLRLKYWTNLTIWLFSYSAAMKKTIIGLSFMVFPAILFAQYDRGNDTNDQIQYGNNDTNNQIQNCRDRINNQI